MLCVHEKSNCERHWINYLTFTNIPCDHRYHMEILQIAIAAINTTLLIYRLVFMEFLGSLRKLLSDRGDIHLKGERGFKRGIKYY